MKNFNIINKILLDYVIIKLSESKTLKRAFRYYVITEGGGRKPLKGLCMIMEEGEGVGFVMP